MTPELYLGLFVVCVGCLVPLGLWLDHRTRLDDDERWDREDD